MLPVAETVKMSPSVKNILFVTPIDVPDDMLPLSIKSFLYNIPLVINAPALAPKLN